MIPIYGHKGIVMVKYNSLITEYGIVMFLCIFSGSENTTLTYHDMTFQVWDRRL